MSNFDNRLEWSSKLPPVIAAFILLFVAIFGFTVIGQLVGLLVGFPFYEGDAKDYIQMISSSSMQIESLKVPLFILQGVSSLIGFVILPALFMIFYERQTIHVFFKKTKTSTVLLCLTPIIGLVFMGVNAFFVEWNAGVSLPESWSGFEQTIRSFEDRAAEMTTHLTTFDSFAMFVLGFIVIAIIPGIGEELVFRGFIQNYLHKSSSNIHVAIWASAFLFSAIHMQFYGFVPRMLLGALFGYLYYWSGNLIIPVLAHVFNNGFTVVMMYLHQRSVIDIDLESTELVPISFVLISAIFTIGLLFYFRKTAVETYHEIE